MTERDLERWSREVAEDPGAPPFVRLARAYRRQGRHTAARDVVLGGLAAHPDHVDAHALLALIHIDSGDRQQARDEWETILRLDPGNFDASRGLGFLSLERGDLPAARRHLDAAAHARPDDPAVAQARQVLDRRERAAAEPASPAQPDTATRSPTASSPRTPSGGAHAPPGAGARGGAVRDPVRLFAPLAVEGPFQGALVVDDQGLVLAGRIETQDRPDDLLGALLMTTVAEAGRAAEIVRLGLWREMLLDTAGATLHLTALTGGAVLVVVAEPGTPAGWVVRTAGRARELATGFLEEAR